MNDLAIRKTAAGLVLALLPALGSQAETCTLDPVPGAHAPPALFRAQPGPVRGGRHRDHGQQRRSGARLVHLTFWTNWAQPTISFDFYLTGYDVQTISLRDAFKLGNIPITADQQSDPSDAISPAGDPAWDGDFPGCENFFPSSPTR